MTTRESKPADDRPARVSPTAPNTKSASTNIWRLLESDQSFVDGMEEARRERAQGLFGRFRGKRPASAK